MRRVRSGDRKNAARFFVQPVNDARTKIAIHRRQTSKVVKQCVDQCSRMVTRSGMNNHSSRLIDNDNIPVLVQDLEW